MDLRTKIGQMIMMGFPEANLSPDLLDFLSRYKIGNFILFAPNIQDADQMRGLCDDLSERVSRNTGLPPFIALDEEGGIVSRMPGSATSTPSAMAIGATKRPENARIAYRILGEEMLALGVNVDFAPVLDINRPYNPVIGVRAFGEDRETVAKFGVAAVQGLRDAGVIAVGKHFPGHGDVKVDSHIELPRLQKSMEEFDDVETYPFRKAMEAGIDGIMTAHILCSSLDDVPATMSRKIVTGMLKEKYGFHGLVFSDALEMDAIRAYYGCVNAAVRAVKAGVHILCVAHGRKVVEEIVQALEAAVHTGEIPEQTIDEAVSKIQEYKCGMRAQRPSPSVVGCVAHRAEAERISRESLRIVWRGDATLPLHICQTVFAGSLPIRLNQASNAAAENFNFAEYMCKIACRGGAHPAGRIIPLDPNEDEIAALAAEFAAYESVVLALNKSEDYPGQIALANRLHNKNVIVVSTNVPYELDRVETHAAKVAVYEYTALAFKSLLKLLL